jgi:lipid-binding SYLF domain-containing protein
MRVFVSVGLAALFLFASISSALAAPDEERERVELAGVILDEIMQIPETGIPFNLLANAAGIAVIPNVLKVGLVVGGRFGRGVLVLRNEQGGWSNPVFISLTGGSFGWQIGAQSTDVILVFKSERSIAGILTGKFTLGADAAVAAGPVGRNMSGAVDTTLRAEIYSYSRSRGLFAGVSLEGSVLQIDTEANGAYYGSGYRSARSVIDGSVGRETPEVARLKAKLAHYVPR